MCYSECSHIKPHLTAENFVHVEFAHRMDHLNLRRLLDDKTVIPREQLEQTRNYGEILASSVYGLAMRGFTVLKEIKPNNWDCLVRAIG
jgi:hypothetical protein